MLGLNCNLIFVELFNLVLLRLGNLFWCIKLLYKERWRLYINTPFYYNAYRSVESYLLAKFVSALTTRTLCIICLKFLGPFCGFMRLYQNFNVTSSPPPSPQATLKITQGLMPGLSNACTLTYRMIILDNKL